MIRVIRFLISKVLDVTLGKHEGHYVSKTNKDS